MSIRLRLTLLYSAILALTLILFSTTLYVSQAHATYDSIKHNLVEQARAWSNPSGRSPGSLPPGSAPPRPGFSPNLGLPSGTLPGRYTQTRSADGTIIGQTLDLNGTSLPLSAKGLQTVQSARGWFETAQVQSEPVLIYSQPFTAQGGSSDIVQVAFPIAQIQQSLNVLRLILLVGCSLAILAAFLIGWVLAGVVLQPIHRITSTARAIGAERNFSHRVEHTGPSDEVGQLAVTFNDMLAELESAYRQLETTLDSQRRFVADASHELRTPLTTVRGNIELLRRDPPIEHDEQVEVLADTTEEVNRLIRLVNQLLVLARADAGQPLRRDAVALRPLLEDVCRQAKQLNSHKLLLSAALPDTLLVGDRDALKQVLLILIDNAHTHTTPGTQITLSATSAGGNVAISVQDDGPGIAADVLPHIFERFYREEVSRSGRSTGLGLAIAKTLVEEQNGTITVDSEVGKGSTFTVILPAAQ